MNCNTYVDCPGNPSFPLLGFNSETPDVQTFTAEGFGPGVPPPLNFDFGLTEGFAIASSTVSVQAALNAANAEATANAVATWIPPGNLPPIMPGDNEESYEQDDEFIGVPPIY